MKPLFKSVLVVEDHKMVANGIKLLVGPLFENFQMAYDGAGGMSKALQHFPELAIVDFVLPDTRGDLFVKELKNKIPLIKVLAYTFDYTSDTIVKMIRSGVNGYLLKSGSDEEFIKAIHLLMKEQDTFCKEARAYISKRNSEIETGQLIRYTISGINFSGKEVELIHLLCKQQNTKEISNHLGLSERTVEQYRSKILYKTGSKSFAGIVKFALQNGMLSIDDL